MLDELWLYPILGQDFFHVVSEVVTFPAVVALDGCSSVVWLAFVPRDLCLNRLCDACADVGVLQSDSESVPTVPLTDCVDVVVAAFGVRPGPGAPERVVHLIQGSSSSGPEMLIVCAGAESQRGNIRTLISPKMHRAEEKFFRENTTCQKTLNLVRACDESVRLLQLVHLQMSGCSLAIWK